MDDFNNNYLLKYFGENKMNTISATNENKNRDV